jgi:dienelactone hydrolase
MADSPTTATSVRIPAGADWLSADLSVTPDPKGLVIFAHGSGSGRHSPRNQAVALVLQQHGLATVLADLLTPQEERIDRRTAQLRFEIDLLGRRVVALVDWARREPTLQSLDIGLFGASTGAAAALVAATIRPGDVGAVVCRGGRPDLAATALPTVRAATLLLVGSLDTEVLELNRWAIRQMRCTASLLIVPGASHLFEEAGTLDDVAEHAAHWFVARLTPRTACAPPSAGSRDA